METCNKSLWWKEMKIEEILLKLTKDERFDNMTWVGKNYSIRDLKKDLREILNDKIGNN